MTLLEAIATMANEMTVGHYKQVSIEIGDLEAEAKDNILIEARCYPEEKDRDIAVFKLTFDTRLNKGETA